MMNGLHAWEFISGFQRRLQDVSFRIVAAMLVWSGLASCMRPHIVFALGQEGAATKSLTFHVRSVHVLTGLLLFPFLHALVIWFFLLFSHSFLCMHAYYGAFQKSELKQNWPAGTGHFENEIGFFKELLMENDFLRTWCLGFDWFAGQKWNSHYDGNGLVGAVNKTRIGSDSGSDRTGIFAFGEAELFWEKLCLIITQVTRNKKFEFSQQLGVWPITSPDTFGLFTGSTQIFFFRADAGWQL